MNKNKYWWIKKLVNKITKTSSPLNNGFTYYGYNVEQSSGMRDFTSVVITDSKHNYVADFGFDFWTDELIFYNYIDYEIRNKIVKAFADIYNSINVIDNTLTDITIECHEYIDNPDLYVEEAVEEAKKELETINNLPIGKVTKSNLK